VKAVGKLAPIAAASFLCCAEMKHSKQKDIA